MADEASAPRSAVILSDELPQDLGARMRALIRRQIQTAVDEEWPVQEQRASLTAIPTAMADALDLAVDSSSERSGGGAASSSPRFRTPSTRAASESS